MQQSARACIEVTSLRVAASRVSRVVRLARAQKSCNEMVWDVHAAVRPRLHRGHLVARGGQPGLQGGAPGARAEKL